MLNFLIKYKVINVTRSKFTYLHSAPRVLPLIISNFILLFKIFFRKNLPKDEMNLKSIKNREATSKH